ncbi:unnamed protein product [Schistocephalus solidus]|uniref:Ovule protein n=1 Tax=Schistocephalus solidus TaxID=70667 RepID=A0A183S7L3_SCHSO|nr:unnamed protein product [Schistocephalus solidus]
MNRWSYAKDKTVLTHYPVLLLLSLPPTPYSLPSPSTKFPHHPDPKSSSATDIRNTLSSRRVHLPDRFITKEF